jgi:hypothetical protein
MGIYKIIYSGVLSRAKVGCKRLKIKVHMLVLVNGFAKCALE